MYEESIGVEITNEQGVTIVALRATSISNPAGIESVSEQINKFIEAGCPNKMVIDFSEVKFFSSGVLGVLLDIRTRLKKYNGEVVISAIEPQLHRVFKITNLDRIFRFFPDRETAVKIVNED